MRDRVALLGDRKNMIAGHRDYPNCHSAVLEVMQVMMQNMST